MHKFWNFTNPEDEASNGKLYLYGTIAEDSWFDDDVTPALFYDELNKMTGPIDVYINSPGGDCFAASQIYTMLSEYPHEVTVKIDGVAASAASVIAMAGNEVLMARTAMMMIHNPATLAWGDHKDMEQTIKMLNEVKESIINAYEKKTGLSRQKLSQYMDDETWMNSEKAVELGFADGLIGEEASGNGYIFSSSNVEKNIINKVMDKAQKNKKEEPSGRSINLLKARLEAYKKMI